MTNGEIVVSGEALNPILISFAYIVALGLARARLLPQLSPSVAPIAIGLMLAQVAVIAISTFYAPASSYEAWLWHLDREFNIPSTLAFAQLAMCGGAALLAAWLARAAPAWQRLYLAAVGAIFLYWAIDEYFKVHEFNRFWHFHYAALGAIMAIGAVLVAWRSPRPYRIWYARLLLGLALTATGAILIERLPTRIPTKICEDLGFLRFDPCLETYRLEEAFEFLGIWLALVAILGLLQNLTRANALRLRRALYVLPAAWLCIYLGHALLPRFELELLAQQASVEFESRIQLRGYQFETGEDDVRVRLYLSAKPPDMLGLGSSINLVDQADSESVAHLDKRADYRHGIALLGTDFAQVFGQSIQLVYPSGIPVNRALWVVLALWRDLDGEFPRQKIIASDLKQLSDTQVVLGELVIPAPASPSGGAAAGPVQQRFFSRHRHYPRNRSPRRNPEPHVHLAQRGARQ